MHRQEYDEYNHPPSRGYHPDHGDEYKHPSPERPPYQARQRPPGHPLDGEGYRAADPERYIPDPKPRDQYSEELKYRESEFRGQDQRERQEWGPRSKAKGHLLETPTDVELSYSGSDYFEQRQKKLPPSLQDLREGKKREFTSSGRRQDQAHVDYSRKQDRPDDKPAKPLSLLDLPLESKKPSLLSTPPVKDLKPPVSKDSKQPPSLLDLPDVKPIGLTKSGDNAGNDRQRSTDFREDYEDGQYKDSRFGSVHKKSIEDWRSHEEESYYPERRRAPVEEGYDRERRYENPSGRSSNGQGSQREPEWRSAPEEGQYHYERRYDHRPGKRIDEYDSQREPEWRAVPEKRMYHPEEGYDNLPGEKRFRDRESPYRDSTMPEHGKFHQRPERYRLEQDAPPLKQRAVGNEEEFSLPSEERLLKDVGHRDERLMASRPDNTAYMYKMTDDSRQKQR